MHRWFIAKMFFDWVPIPLPAYTRKDGDFLLAQPRDYPEMIYLNKPGAFILEQCDGQTSVESILKRYMVEFLRSDRAAVAYEVIQVLRQLDRRLIVYFGSPEAIGQDTGHSYERTA